METKNLSMSPKSQKYLKTVFKTIEKYKLVENKDNIFVALSGGKDSACALFSLKKYIEEKDLDARLKGFHINFGLPISDRVQQIVEKQAKLAGVELIAINAKKDLGIDIGEAMKRSARPICSICGVLKRYLINKIPREMNASKVATGHHMDDFVVFFFKNILNQKYFWSSKFRPKLEPIHPKQITKIRPLFFVGSKDNNEFCEENDIPFVKAEVCPHAYYHCKVDASTEKWYKIIYSIEQTHKNFRRQLLKSVIKMSKFFEMADNGLKECKICGEPTNREICSFCRIFRVKS